MLTIKVIQESELERFKSLARSFHSMGEGHAAGDTLRLVVEANGEWIALFLWGSAAYRLKDRDSWIGWNPAVCAQRQKLIVQHRRFVLLAKPGEHPNLASRILGQMIRELPDLWDQRFGYRPLLAETFSAIEAREGTCYKASGWLALGQTKGYSRHRADFYVPHDRPKKLWVRELRKGAAALLRAAQLPDDCLRGAHSDADGVMPLKMPQIESLHAVLCKAPEPRAGNSAFHIGGMLSIVALAMFSGHRNLAQRVRFAEGTRPVALARDGKFIRETVGIVCLADHQTGVPYAMANASQKEGEGDDGELIRREADLSHAIITADALNCPHETARDIVERGGEYRLQVKDNQKKIHQQSALKTEALSPLLPRRKKGMDASPGSRSAFPTYKR